MNYGFVKVASAIPSVRVADCRYNILQIESLIIQAEGKGVEIIEGEVCPDHIHMLVSIPPKMSVSVFMGYFNPKRTKI